MTADEGGNCAAVDVGSNSVRLLIQDAEGVRLRRDLRITRLAQGVDATGHLDDDALQRTLEALTEFRGLWTACDVPTSRVRIAATSAVRDASDRYRFFDGVAERTGVVAEVLRGDEEAALAFSGAVGSVEVTRPVMVVDIGGGSTEIIVGDVHDRVVASVSLQLGCVRATERWLASDPPSPAERAAATAAIRSMIDRAFADLAADVRGSGVALADVGDVVAVAGTATTLAALALGLETYDEDRIHGTRLTVGDVLELADRLLGMSATERAQLGPMQPGRADVVHAGALILATILPRAGCDTVVVSEADSLDGLVASLQPASARAPGAHP